MVLPHSPKTLSMYEIRLKEAGLFIRNFKWNDAQVESGEVELFPAMKCWRERDVWWRRLSDPTRSVGMNLARDFNAGILRIIEPRRVSDE